VQRNERYEGFFVVAINRDAIRKWYTECHVA